MRGLECVLFRYVPLVVLQTVAYVLRLSIQKQPEGIEAPDVHEISPYQEWFDSRDAVPAVRVAVHGGRAVLFQVHEITPRYTAYSLSGHS